MEFLFCIILIIAIIVVAVYSKSLPKYKTDGLTQQIYLALEAIYAMQHTSDYMIFSSKLSLLKEISQTLATNKEESIEYKKREAINMFTRKHTNSRISRRQEEFLSSLNIEEDNGCLAKMEARFFIDFCEKMRDRIELSNTDKEREELKGYAKEVATKLIADLKRNDHVALARGIAQDVSKLGVRVNTSTI